MFRGILNVSEADSSPRKLKLVRMVKNKEAHIRNLKKMCRERAHDIKALIDLSDSSVVQNIFRGMSKPTTTFLMSQLRCAKRKPKGRRWTLEEKVMALALLKRSPKGYNLLRKFVAMPSRRTLLSLLEKVPFHSGINPHIFEHISEVLEDPKDKVCALLFDEMDIKEHLQYDAKLDCIVGFDGESKKFANRALVFMCQGLARNWKQPVAYYFSSNGFSSSSLKDKIEEVIRAAEAVGKLEIVTLICDMGSTNVKTLKEMGSSAVNPYILVDNKKIFTMYDPPHLLKCTVSLFRKHNISLPVSAGGCEMEMEARFSDIVKAHDIDKNTPLIFRAMHKITNVHLAPKMRFAMKVNIAAQIMSRTVAAFLYTLLSRGKFK